MYENHKYFSMNSTQHQAQAKKNHPCLFTPLQSLVKTNLPKWFVQLMNDNGALVEASPCHNCIIATKGALIGEAPEVIIKAYVILHKRLKVISEVEWMSWQGKNGGRKITHLW